jgi:hypothetical protein
MERVEKVIDLLTKQHMIVWAGDPNLLRELVTLEVYQEMRIDEEKYRAGHSFIISMPSIMRGTFLPKDFKENAAAATKRLHTLVQHVYGHHLRAGSPLYEPWTKFRLVAAKFGFARNHLTDLIKWRLVYQEIPKVKHYSFSDCVVWKALAEHYPAECKSFQHNALQRQVKRAFWS